MKTKNTQAFRYFELTKPKVTLLNLLVGVTCFVLASIPSINYFGLALFAIVGYLAAGGCGVLNSVYDRDIDKRMERTAKRAIPAGYILPQKAAAFGAGMIILSIVFASVLFNSLTALMVGLGTAFYLLIYTFWLKRRSPWNVVIGGFAGCFAALSGWAAAVNMLSIMPFLVSMIDFLWTPGHLWGLAIKKMKEYTKVGVPMLPVVYGLNKAAKVVFWLNVLTVAFSLVPMVFFTGPVYLTVAVVAGAFFILKNKPLLFSATESNGFTVFMASMPYLLCLMIALIIDKLIFI